MHMDTHVVVAGWGQVTQPKETKNPLDPPGLMIQAAERAGQTLTDPSVLSRLDGIMVVRPLSAHCPDAPDRVARALGANPGFLHISNIGGEFPPDPDQPGCRPNCGKPAGTGAGGGGGSLCETAS
jgi:acetyl-CoA C-acetyltransferase